MIVLNGDVLSGHDLTAQLELHRTTEAAVTLHLVGVEDPRAFGCVPTDGDGRVTAFLEKTPTPITDQINAGCYIFRREVIDSIPAGVPVSVERDTFPGLLAAGAPVLGYREDAYWLDVGTPAAFVQGSADLVRGVLPSAAVADPGEVLIGEGALVAEDAVLTGGTTVGAGCVIGSGAVVEGSVLFDDVWIAAGAASPTASSGPAPGWASGPCCAESCSATGPWSGPTTNSQKGPGCGPPRCCRTPQSVSRQGPDGTSVRWARRAWCLRKSITDHRSCPGRACRCR